MGQQRRYTAAGHPGRCQGVLDRKGTHTPLCRIWQASAPCTARLGAGTAPAAPWRKDVFLPRGLPGAGSASCFEAPKRIEQGALCGFRAAADGVAARVRPAAGPRSGRGRHGFLRFFLRAASVAASEVVHVTLPPALPRGGRPAARLAHSAGLCARGFRFRGVGRQKRHPSGPGRGHVRAHVLRLRAVCVCKHVGRGRGRAVHHRRRGHHQPALSAPVGSAGPLVRGVDARRAAAPGVRRYGRKLRRARDGLSERLGAQPDHALHLQPPYPAGLGGRQRFGGLLRRTGQRRETPGPGLRAHGHVSGPAGAPVRRPAARAGGLVYPGAFRCPARPGHEPVEHCPGHGGGGQPGHGAFVPAGRQTARRRAVVTEGEEARP